MVKHLSAMQETRVWSLGREDPLEKGMTTHSNVLAWRIPWTEEPCGLQSMGSQRVGHDWVMSLAFSHTSTNFMHLLTGWVLIYAHQWSCEGGRRQMTLSSCVLVSAIQYYMFVEKFYSLEYKGVWGRVPFFTWCCKAKNLMFFLFHLMLKSKELKRMTGT